MLAFVLELLQILYTLRKPLVVKLQFLYLFGFRLELGFELLDVLVLLLHGGSLLFQVVPKGLVLLLEFFVIVFEVFHLLSSTFNLFLSN